MRRKHEKMSKKREYEKKKRDYENKKLFKIQKGKKPENITKNAHCNAKNVSQQVAQYKNVFFPELYSLFWFYKFLAIQISGARIDPELEVRFFVLVYKNPPPDAGNEEDEGDD